MRCVGQGALLAVVLACGGCFSAGATDLDRLASTEPALPANNGPPPVRASQVTAENCREIAQALWDELDREQQRNALASR